MRPNEHIANFGKGKVTRALAFNGLNDVRALNAGFVGRTTRDDSNDGSIAKALRDGRSNIGLAFQAMRLVLLVLSRGQVAGVGVERFQQAM